jgi:hypothetical protein
MGRRRTWAYHSRVMRTALIPIPVLFLSWTRPIEVVVNSLHIHAGEQVNVCYKVRNAKRVMIVPGDAVNVLTPEHGCVADKPLKTTTYTLTASNTEGIKDTERVTVTVKWS